MTGLASGLIETTREIGGVIGVAAVSTVLVSQPGDIPGAAGPAARALATSNAFDRGFWVVFVIAALGAMGAAISFPRSTTQELDPVALSEATGAGR